MNKEGLFDDETELLFFAGFNNKDQLGIYVMNKTELNFISFKNGLSDKQYGTIKYKGKTITIVKNYSDIVLALDQKSAAKEFQNHKSYKKVALKIADFNDPSIDTDSPSFHRSLDKYIVKSLSGMKDFLLTTRILQDKLGNKFIDPGVKTMHTYKLCKNKYSAVKDEIISNAFESTQYELSQVVKVSKKTSKKKK